MPKLTKKAIRSRRTARRTDPNYRKTTLLKQRLYLNVHKVILKSPDIYTQINAYLKRRTVSYEK